MNALEKALQIVREQLPVNEETEAAMEMLSSFVEERTGEEEADVSLRAFGYRDGKNLTIATFIKGNYDDLIQTYPLLGKVVHESRDTKE